MLQGWEMSVISDDARTREANYLKGGPLETPEARRERCASFLPNTLVCQDETGVTGIDATSRNAIDANAFVCCGCIVKHT